MATDSVHEDPSLIALVEAAWDRPAFREGAAQLSRGLVALVPSQTTLDAMSSSVLPLGQALAQALALPHRKRERANRRLDEAYRAERAAAASARSDPDEEEVTAPADTVREFTSFQAGSVSRDRQKQVFVCFFGLLTLLVLVQASFQSETADAVLVEALQMAPLAAAVMIVADRAFDRYGCRSEDEDDADGQEHDTH
ncbi:hypothetical protein ABT033_05065 [Streptomyces pharetrae]|uniref:hypothetical protein n=1 Tax=Streptomyces pharetrae TaxID=291370 RepID=UPI003360B123